MVPGASCQRVSCPSTPPTPLCLSAQSCLRSWAFCASYPDAPADEPPNDAVMLRTTSSVLTGWSHDGRSSSSPPALSAVAAPCPTDAVIGLASGVSACAAASVSAPACPPAVAADAASPPSAGTAENTSDMMSASGRPERICPYTHSSVRPFASSARVKSSIVSPALSRNDSSLERRTWSVSPSGSSESAAPAWASLSIRPLARVM